MKLPKPVYESIPALYVITGITDPEPITTMDISYENAFGGAEFPKNPLGKGMIRVAAETAPDLILMDLKRKLHF